MSPNELDHIFREFEWDGTWRDIVMRDWSLAQWDEFIRWISGAGRPFEFRIDGHIAALPAHAAEIFKIGERASPLLRVTIGPGVANCHFFDDSDFELDIDPRDHQSPETMRPLLEFVADLARAIRRSVLITHENSPDLVIAEFDLASDCFVVNPTPSE